MILPRADVFRAVLRSSAARASRPTARIRPSRQIGRRTYASHGGHETKKAGGDLPWLIGAVTVTVPSCAYLLQPSANKDHGHGHGDEGHGEHAEHDEHEEGEDHEEHEEHEEGEEHEEHEEHEEASEGENAADASSEGKDGDNESELKGDEAPDKPIPQNKGDHEKEGDSEGSDSEGGDGEQQDTPDTSDDESSIDKEHRTGPGGDVEGVQFKGATKDGKMGDVRKHIPDAKGGNKKRIESDAGIRQGVADEEPMREAEGSHKDKAAASKPVLDQNQQSGKQEHISNSDTKHSIDLTTNRDKSRKGEGTPETSKSKGTVDPSRPQK